MSRDTDSAITTANAQPVIDMAVLAKIELTSGTICVCTGQRFISVGVNTYAPVGGFGGVEGVRETAELGDRDLRLWLVAVNSAQLTDAINEDMFGKAVRLYRATLNVNRNTVVGTPQQFYRGVINKVDIKLGDPERGDHYVLECQRRQKREGASAYYNRETLTLVYSGDTGMDYVDRIPGFQSNWGGNNQSFSKLTPAANPGAAG